MVKMESVWNEMSGFLRSKAGPLLLIVVPGIFAPLVIGELAGIVQQEAVESSAAMMMASIVNILAALVLLWAQVAVTAMALDPVLGVRAAKVGLLRLPLIIGVFLIIGIVLMIAALPVFYVLWHAGMAEGTMHAPDISPMTLALILLYTILLVAALVLIGARLTLTTPVVVAENVALSAVRRSWRLTRGYGSTIIGIVILFIIVTLVARLAVKTVLGSALLLFMGGEGAFSPAILITLIATAMVMTIFSVIQFAFLAKLYLALAKPFESKASYSE